MHPVESLRERTLTWTTNSVEVAISNGKPCLDIRKGEGYEEQLELTPESFIRLGQLCGIPGPYSSKCPIDLIVPHLNYWAPRMLEEIKLLISLEDKVEAFAKPNTDFVLPSTILSIVEDVLGDDVSYDKVSFDVDFCHVGVTSPRTSFGEGDEMMNGGLSVAFSPDGKYPMTMSSYLLKMICTNGLVAPMNTFKWRRNSNENVESWLAQAAAMAVEAVASEANRLLDMKNFVMDGHVGDVLDSLFQTYRVPVDIRDMVTDRVLNTGATTMYDLVDAFTYIVSNDIELGDDPRARHRMMMAAGEMTAHPQACPACHRVFRG